jgi:hypothetical protein
LYGYDPGSTKDRERYIRIRQTAEQLKYVLTIPIYRRLIDDGSNEAMHTLPSGAG